MAKKTTATPAKGAGATPEFVAPSMPGIGIGSASVAIVDEYGSRLGEGEHDVEIVSAELVFSNPNDNWDDRTPQALIKVKELDGDGTQQFYMNLLGYRRGDTLTSAEIASGKFDVAETQGDAKGYAVFNTVDAKGNPFTHRIENAEATATAQKMLGKLAANADIDAEELTIDEIIEALPGSEVGICFKLNPEGYARFRYSFVTEDESEDAPFK